MRSPNTPQGIDNSEHDNSPTEVTGVSRIHNVVVLDKLQYGLISEVDRLYNVPAVAFPEKGIPLGYSVPAVELPEPPYVELEDTEEIRRSMRLTQEEQEPDEITYENVVSVDASIVDKAKQYKDKVSKDIVDSTFSAGAMNLLACSEAFSITESVLAQHFDVKSNLEDTVSPLLNGLLQLSVVTKVAESYGLPTEVKNRYLTVISNLIARHSHEEAVKKAKGDLKSAVLRNLTATLDEEEQKTIGVRSNR